MTFCMYIFLPFILAEKLCFEVPNQSNFRIAFTTALCKKVFKYIKGAGCAQNATYLGLNIFLFY